METKMTMTPLTCANKSDLFRLLNGLGPSDRVHFSPHDFSESSINDIIAKKRLDQYFLTYAENGNICAYSMIRGKDEGYDMPSIGLCIDKAYRGKGLGKKIIAFLLRTAADMGASRVMLKVHKANSAAIHLYRQIGFQMHDYSDLQLIGYISLSSILLESLERVETAYQ